MRVRALDANLDMTFGKGEANFLIDSRAAVAQNILTRLKLIAGEWFLDTTEGTPYGTEILGNVPQVEADAAIRSRILGTVGVTEITDYSSALAARKLTVTANVDTVYGSVTVETTLP